MGAVAALTRTLCIAAAIGCAAPRGDGSVLTESERIVGRARIGGSVAILTTMPAVITVDPASRQVTRRPIRAADRSGPELWGLGEADGIFYSLSGFNSLVRVYVGSNEATVAEAAKLTRAVGNLIDTATGMAAQFAVDDRGRPLVWSIDRGGTMSAIRGPSRQSLGLSRAEESLLHLISCSPPPRALCWTPGSNQIFSFDENQLQHLARLETVRRLQPRAVFAAPETRSIRDALWTGDGLIAALFETERPAGQPVVGEFDLTGRLVRELATPEPVRLFIAASARSILAIGRSGHLMEVPR